MMITAYTNEAGIVVALDAADAPSRKGLSSRQWPAIGVLVGWRWDETLAGFVPGRTVPNQVTMRQARLALLGAGLLDGVDAAIAAIEDETQRRAAQITWDFAQEVRRDFPLVLALAGAFGLTDAQIDELFIAAAQL
jgi:hypothetical protein